MIGSHLGWEDRNQGWRRFHDRREIRVLDDISRSHRCLDTPEIVYDTLDISWKGIGSLPDVTTPTIRGILGKEAWTMALWSEQQAFYDLLVKLVRFPSVTGTEGERAFPEFLVSLLAPLPYFQQHPDHLRVSHTRDGRPWLLAMVTASPHPETVILLSHFDVVDVKDYGPLTDQAFDPETLTAYLRTHLDELPPEVKADLGTGNWMFGRGIMDMKAGLAMQMALLAEAASGELPANLILLSVPDEEVNSVGMQDALGSLLSWQERHHLSYVLLLNAEPIFPKHPGDLTHYLYTGSIGKVLPGFYCYGKETHVGEPLSGLNANYMAAQLTRALEWNPSFLSESHDAPPPTNLYQRSLKETYSVQTPYRAVTLTNLLITDQRLTTATDQLLALAKVTADEIVRDYQKKTSGLNKNADPFKIRVVTYQELRQEAIEHYGEEVVRSMEIHIATTTSGDERDRCIAIVDELARLEKSQAPMIVLFFAPPFYPAVNSSAHPLISSLVDTLKARAQEIHGISLQADRYYGGLSDLSFGGSDQGHDISVLVDNLPLWQHGYELPLASMQQFKVPVFNVGPWGRDAHKWTERLDFDYAYHVALDFLRETIRHSVVQERLTGS